MMRKKIKKLDYEKYNYQVLESFQNKTLQGKEEFLQYRSQQKIYFSPDE